MAHFDADPAVTVVAGADRALVSAAVTDTVARTVAAGRVDPTEVVRLAAGTSAVEIETTARTVPLFSDTRLVVVQAANTLPEPELAALLRYLADPEPATTTVVVWEDDKLPRPLLEIAGADGNRLVDRRTPTAADRGQRVAALLAGTDVRLTQDARALLAAHAGEDLASLTGVLDLLAATFGDASVDAEATRPLLASAGAVPPWELTDRIDAGDTAGALRTLNRLLVAGRAPLQLLAVISTHVDRAWRLSAAGVSDERTGAGLLGVKGSTFPVRKAIGTGKRAGPGRLEQAALLVASAQVDLRGGSAWPDSLVLEVLVARLALLLGRR